MQLTIFLNFFKLSMIVTALIANGCKPGNNLHDAPVTKYAKMERDVLYYINEYRTSKGLQPLQWNNVIYPLASEHSVDMAAHKVAFGHDGFDARFNAIKNKLGYLRGAAENVALGHLDAKAVVKGWLNSPGHKKNIEGNYNLTAIGIAQGNDGNLYFTQIFINKPSN